MSGHLEAQIFEGGTSDDTPFIGSLTSYMVRINLS